jgi:hypothetical protein
MKNLYTFDLPVTYKGIKLYPAKVKDYYLFFTFIQPLFLERASDSNPMVSLTMTRLEYMLYKSLARDENGQDKFTEGSPAEMFVNLLGLLTNADSDFHVVFGFGKDKKPTFTIGTTTYTSDDYEKIREIICEQNDVPLPDENIQLNVRREIEEARRYKDKLRGTKIANFEEQMVALSSYTGISLNQIYELTIRKFYLYIKRVTHMIYQDAYLKASLSGMVEFKDKSILQGWLSEIQESKNSDVTLDLEEVQNKISGASTGG